MSVAIIGKNIINDVLSEKLESEGFDFFIIVDPDSVKNIVGEVGDFTITIKENTPKDNASNREIKKRATHIIITEEPSSAKLYLDGISFQGDHSKEPWMYEYMPVVSPAEMEKYIGDVVCDSRDKISAALKDKDSPIVFLQDFKEESEGYNTGIMLNEAEALAAKKKKVVYLFRFMKTAGSAEESLEEVYSDARNKGVVFIRYDNLNIKYDIDSNTFLISVFYRGGSIDIRTGLIVWAWPFYPTGKLEEIFKLLRLRTDDEGFANGKYNFLYPALTSLKGVFFINTKLLPGGKYEEEECIKFIMSSIKEDLLSIKFYGNNNLSWYAKHKNIYGLYYAEIDSKKCAFCYTCYRICPHQAMFPDHDKSVMMNFKNACHGCGICESVCPANAITIMKNYDFFNKCSDDVNSKEASFEGKSGYAPDKRKRRPLRIICCENSGEVAVRRALSQYENEFDGICNEDIFKGKDKDDNEYNAINDAINNNGDNNKVNDIKSDSVSKEIEIVSVSCGGQINAEMIIESLENFEKVMILVCFDKACKHFDGNKRSRLAVLKAKNLLTSLGLDENRIIYLEVSHAMPDAVKETINKQRNLI